MQTASISRPAKLSRPEWIILAAVIALCLVLANVNKGRREKHAYQNFIIRSERVQNALERFAADHGGYPPDAMFTGAPKGLSPKYISWCPSWKIDYEVHPNGHGGKYVCLELCGPFKERLYYGLCNKPKMRKLYGRGQPIPGYLNRIWLIKEDAPILPPDHHLLKDK